MPAMGACAMVGRVPSSSLARARLARIGWWLSIAVCALGAACAGKTPSPAGPSATAPSAPPPPPVAGIPSGPPVELTPASVARGYQLGAISIASFDRLLQNGTKLVG